MDIDTARTDTIAEAEYPRTPIEVSLLGGSLWWQVAGMAAVTLLTVAVIVLTLVLGSSH